MSEHLQPQFQMNAIQDMMVRLEYVWLDGYTTKNLRSKVRYENWRLDTNEGLSREAVLSKCPQWSYDGSSTGQADTSSSDIMLNPVRVYANPLEETDMPSFFVLCETMTMDTTPEPIESNSRAILRESVSGNREEYWFAPEQEYFIVDRTNTPINFDKDTQEGQGRYYCGAGGLISGRELVETHAAVCQMMRLPLCGTNAEVAPSQWEYQLSPTEPLEAADDLWMSRYLLMRIAEKAGVSIDFSPKPLGSEWNGSGCHINFSTKKMREEGGSKYIHGLIDQLKETHKQAMRVYGEGNEDRLTGDCETQHYDKFTHGNGDRTASIRIPMFTVRNSWKGYIEDRRPGGNMDPYEAYAFVLNTLENSLEKEREPLEVK